MAGEDITVAAPIPWWRQVIRYLGVCMVESLLAMLLLVAHFTVVLPRLSGNTSGGVVCGLLGLIVLAPAFWLLSVIVFLAAKLLVIWLPSSRRHWALAAYWGLALAVVAQGLWETRDTAASTQVRLLNVAFFHGAAVVPALVLTLTHFLLLPHVAPGATAGDALRALLRRKAKGADAITPPPAP